jgi:hypothetical protein
MAWRVVLERVDNETLVLDYRREPHITVGEGLVRISDGDPTPAMPRGEQFTGELWERSANVERIHILNLETNPPRGFPTLEQDALAS